MWLIRSPLPPHSGEWEVRLIIMSRKQIEDYIGITSPAIAICIAYPNGRLHKVEPIGELLAVHHTRFSDCDADAKWTFPETKDESSGPPIPMTRGQAIDILDFVDAWKDKVDTIYIACYGGISRSAGIGAGLAAVYGWDDKHIYETRIPNVHCKSLLIRESDLGEAGKP